ncbi:MAG: DUF192 domain-containing protein [Rickettsiales bacterium]|nr:DUF192 domain-containing protein [Rickettsiales bacterium]
MRLKNTLIFLIFALSALGLVHGPALLEKPRPTLAIQTPTAAVIFEIDIADDATEQVNGLMHRLHIPENYGMLFVWSDDDIRTMWMKNTPSPLDMLFIDKNGIIRYIVRNTPPLSEALISSGRPARAVLELAGGSTTQHNIQVGDRVIHPLFQAPSKTKP